MFEEREKPEMSAYVWKAAIVIGLGLCLAGLILMIKGQVWQVGDKKFRNPHAELHAGVNKWGLCLTVIGYLLQVYGVIVS